MQQEKIKAKRLSEGHNTHEGHITHVLQGLSVQIFRQTLPRRFDEKQ